MINYARCEHKVNGMTVANLTGNTIMYDGVALPPASDTVQIALQHGTQLKDREYFLISPADELIANFAARPWNTWVIVEPHVYSAVRKLTRSSPKFNEVYRQVVCDDFKDDMGNFI